MQTYPNRTATNRRKKLKLHVDKLVTATIKRLLRLFQRLLRRQSAVNATVLRNTVRILFTAPYGSMAVLMSHKKDHQENLSAGNSGRIYTVILYTTPYSLWLFTAVRWYDSMFRVDIHATSKSNILVATVSFQNSRMDFVISESQRLNQNVISDDQVWRNECIKYSIFSCQVGPLYDRCKWRYKLAPL